MELWPGSSRSQWEIIKSVIDESDYYLVIIASKYGSETTDEYGNEVSYTEMEFDYAVSIGKPVIALIHQKPDSLPYDKSESDTQRRAKLERFRNKAKDGRLIHYWTTKDDLITEAVLAINSEINTVSAKGWIRCPSEDELQVKRSIMIAWPQHSYECTKICDAFLEGKIILLNMEQTDKESARRIIDMIVGTVYGKSGCIRRVVSAAYLITHESDEIYPDIEYGRQYAESNLDAENDD